MWDENGKDLPMELGLMRYRSRQLDEKNMLQVSGTTKVEDFCGNDKKGREVLNHPGLGPFGRSFRTHRHRTKLAGRAGWC